MVPSILPISLLLGVASAAPQFSIPPLVPLIPGVTEPITNGTPPGIILQPPTPPLASPPYKKSNIKPKKIGYFFTAAGDSHHKDFLASFSLDDATFGTLLRVVDLPSSGNAPHHLGASADGKYLWGGGLLSLLKTQDTGYYFDTANPYEPKYLKSDRAALASIADEVRAKPDGGFFFTYMGSAVGTSPGRLIETNANNEIIHQWPEDTEGTLNILGEQFSPHGLSIDFERGNILTSDFVIPATVLRPFSQSKKANTLRLWDLPSRKIISTITIPGGQGIQDVKFIPKNPEGAALATAVGLGEIWIIYPERKGKNGKRGVAKKLIALGDDAKQSVAIFSDVTQDGKFAYFTATTTGRVYSYDISNLNKPKRLDNPKEEQPVLGPHYIKVSPDQKHVMVTDYFLTLGDIGNINTPSTYKAFYMDIQPNGEATFNRSINFPKIFSNRGGARPHSSVMFDLSDPKNPLYF